LEPESVLPGVYGRAKQHAGRICIASLDGRPDRAYFVTRTKMMIQRMMRESDRFSSFSRHAPVSGCPENNASPLCPETLVAAGERSGD
jgi:hypothetical protein